jgi:hypothetical protein
MFVAAVGLGSRVRTVGTFMSINTDRRFADPPFAVQRLGWRRPPDIEATVATA